MATANPLIEDNYELELIRVRENIKTEFVELIDCLKARESKLLRELDNILLLISLIEVNWRKLRKRREILRICKMH